MATNPETDAEVDASRRSTDHVAGTLGIVIAVLLAAILGIHPPGNTRLYDDGVAFVEHIGPFWIVIHLLGSLVLVGVPAVVWAWGETLHTPAGRVYGRLAGQASIVGVAIGVLHVAGTDTMAFLAYADTLRAAGDEGAADIGADVLLRMHAATLVAWVVGFFVAVPLALALASGFEGMRGWRFWIPVADAALAASAIVVTLFAGQWTTLSEMFLLRPAITLFVVWLGLTGIVMRRSATTGAVVT